MEFLLPGIFTAISTSLFFYLFLYVSVGEHAVEERKIRNRIAVLVSLRRKNFLRAPIRSVFVFNEYFSQTRFVTFVEELLRYSNFHMAASQFLLFNVLLSMLTSLIVFLMYFNFNMAVLAFLISATIPIIFLMVKKMQYIKNFIINFPDSLMMMKNAIRSGQGIQSAFKTVAIEAAPPVSVEFERMVREIDLGGAPADALNNLYQRIRTSDVRLFVLGIVIQTEIGGNLSELLDNIARTIRDRLSLRREMSALTAQAKLSALILISLPLVIISVMNVISPSYFRPLITSSIGHYIIFAAVFLWTIGTTIVYKMTRGLKIII